MDAFFFPSFNSRTLSQWSAFLKQFRPHVTVSSFFTFVPDWIQRVTEWKKRRKSANKKSVSSKKWWNGHRVARQTEQNQTGIPFGIPCTGLRIPISGSHDVIKIKFQDIDLLEFLLSWSMRGLKTYTFTNCHSERALRFVIRHAWISNLMSDAAFIWRPREISGVRLKSDLFWGFCYLNSFCSTLMFRVPLEMNSRSWEKTQWQIFGWFPATMLVPGQMDTDIASHIQNSINFNCSNMSHNYKKLQRPESWRRSLNIYLLPFPKFWTLYIGRFWFVFIIAWQRKLQLLAGFLIPWALFRIPKPRISYSTIKNSPILFSTSKNFPGADMGEMTAMVSKKIEVS